VVSKTTPILVCPDRRDQVDDEEIVCVNHETDTTNGEELSIRGGDESGETLGVGVLLCFVFLL
jgi:hypothetical protein